MVYGLVYSQAIVWCDHPVRVTQYIHSLLYIISIYYSRLEIAVGYGHISLLSLGSYIIGGHCRLKFSYLTANLF